jgi:ribosomal protein S18 acetylase RimI-like enzyme
MINHLISIRELRPDDSQVIADAFTVQGWNKPVSKYEKYWREQTEGKRTVLVAGYEGAFAGFLTVVWESDYPPFREAHIPEIVDFNVLIKFRRRGIGTALMDTVENLIANQSDTAGIGVGLMSDYGNAQIMYVKRGYIPDGRGINANGQWLKYGDQLTIDDDVALYWTKPVDRTNKNGR